MLALLELIMTAYPLLVLSDYTSLEDESTVGWWCLKERLLLLERHTKTHHRRSVSPYRCLSD